MDIEPNFGTVTSVRAVSHRFFGFVTKVKKSSSNEMGPNKRSLAAGVRGGGGRKFFGAVVCNRNAKVARPLQLRLPRVLVELRLLLVFGLFLPQAVTPSLHLYRIGLFLDGAMPEANVTLPGMLLAFKDYLPERCCSLSTLSAPLIVPRNSLQRYIRRQGLFYDILFHVDRDGGCSRRRCLQE
jgi:hypothetical protein